MEEHKRACIPILQVVPQIATKISDVVEVGIVREAVLGKQTGVPGLSVRRESQFGGGCEGLVVLRCSILFPVVGYPGEVNPGFRLPSGTNSFCIGDRGRTQNTNKAIPTV